MTVIKEYSEGRTTFLCADVEHYSRDQGLATSDLPVFYNKRMQLNRDLSVLFLSTYMKKNPIDLMCEPLTGSGVRTLRYLNECSGEFHAEMFDVNPLAVEMVQKNIELLNFGERALVKQGDAKMLLMTESRGKRFDYVDVDPFGSPAPYLNAAIQSLNPRGAMLTLTATDMPALCGVYPRVALRKYGGSSIRAPFSHEIAVRLLVGLTYSVAGMNDYSISPLAALSTDHYIRVWFGVKADRITSNRQADSMGFMRYCPNCMHLYDSEFLNLAGEMLPDYEDSFHKRVPRLLDLMKKECGLMKYAYVDLHELCDLHNLVPPKTSAVMDELRNMGYRVSQTHFRSTAIRTNGPVSDVVCIIKKLTGEG
jgi:tRNA (guanine26-N2/guanine27-N2)-dimethyltransferase